MFKEVSINPNLDVNQAKVPQTPPSKTSMGADELMDELFHDIEVHLDDPSSVDSLALSTEVQSQTGVLLETPRKNHLTNRHQSSAELDDLLVPYTPMHSTLALQQRVKNPLSLDTASSLQNAKPVNLGKRLFIATACISFAGISMFWVGQQMRWQHTPVVAAAPPPAPPPESPETAVNPETIAFADYVTQSLDRIDREAKTEKLAAAARAKTANQSNQSNADLPNLPNISKVGAASTSPPASTPSNVERVNIPVAGVPVPSLKGKPLAPPANTPVVAAVEASSEKDATLPVVKPLPLTPPSNVERKFLGGTNLGDQPMFMVSINGSTRHVKLGEAVDETGATFVEFDGEQSVLKQGSQLRSVTAGQSF